MNDTLTAKQQEALDLWFTVDISSPAWSLFVEKHGATKTAFRDLSDTEADKVIALISEYKTQQEPAK